LSDNGDNKFKLIFKVGGVAIFKIDVEQSKWKKIFLMYIIH
jgi:hypothetical protein